jgi:hypothetical protein
VPEVMGPQGPGRRPAGRGLELAMQELALSQRPTHGRGEHQAVEILAAAGWARGDPATGEQVDGWLPSRGRCPRTPAQPGRGPRHSELALVSASSFAVMWSIFS